MFCFAIFSLGVKVCIVISQILTFPSLELPSLELRSYLAILEGTSSNTLVLTPLSPFQERGGGHLSVEACAGIVLPTLFSFIICFYFSHHDKCTP